MSIMIKTQRKVGKKTNKLTTIYVPSLYNDLAIPKRLLSERWTLWPKSLTESDRKWQRIMIDWYFVTCNFNIWRKTKLFIIHLNFRLFQSVSMFLEKQKQFSAMTSISWWLIGFQKYYFKFCFKFYPLNYKFVNKIL